MRNLKELVTTVSLHESAWKGQINDALTEFRHKLQLDPQQLSELSLISFRQPPPSKQGDPSRQPTPSDSRGAPSLPAFPASNNVTLDLLRPQVTPDSAYMHANFNRFQLLHRCRRHSQAGMPRLC